MKPYLKPYWVLALVSAPQTLIFLIFSRIFSLVGSRLDESNLKAWMMFGIAFGILWLGSVIYATAVFAARKPVNPYYGAALLVTNISFLYVYLLQSGSVIPGNIPRWMLFGIEPGICLLTLIMPSLAYATLLLVFHFTPEDKKYTIWKEILVTVSIPLLWYLAINIAVPLFRHSTLKVSPHIVAVLFIASSVCFLFMISRLVFLLLLKKPKAWEFARIPVIIVFPVLGLLVNNGVAGLMGMPVSFGDFSHIGYYILAVFSGILLLLPAVENHKLRLGLFFLKAVTFIYIFYFFTVFLPFLPLSIFAVIFAGLGFLMLTPLVLMLIHVKSVWSDYHYLLRFHSRYLLLVVFLAGAAVLPAGITISYNMDRASIGNALSYVYESGYDETLKAGTDLKSIRRALDNIKANKDGGRLERFVSNNRAPYLTAYYNWLVLDNLALSDKKIEKLEQIFFGGVENKDVQNQVNEPAEKHVTVKGLKTETEYDEKGGFYKSWINVELENKSDSQAEYVTETDLPEGTWISNYYLNVNGEKKYGLLVDKRAALWTYQQILNERRDPGILYYLSGNRTAFRVFPFSGHEIRETGIALIHKEPVKLTIDGNEVSLQDEKNGMSTQKEVFEFNDSIVYVPAEVKEKLPKVSRNPYYYFIVDFSKGNEGKIQAYLDRVREFVKEHSLREADFQVAAANYEMKGIDHQGNRQNAMEDLPVKGGLFLERHIKSILAANYAAKPPQYPVIVAVTDNIKGAVMPEDFSDFQITMPDSEWYYALGAEGKITGYPLLKGKSPEGPGTIEEIAAKEALAWPDAAKPEAYLRDDGQGSIVLRKTGLHNEELELGDTTWKNGLILQAMSTGLALEPSQYSRQSTGIIANSFRTKIMTPLTSYIVVEDEAQEKVMLEKQKQLLASKLPLDAGEETQMSEPPLWVLIVGLGIVLAAGRCRRILTGK